MYKEDDAIEVLREGARNMVRELGLLDVEYRNCGLGLSECHILLEIWKRPYATVGDLSVIVNLDKSTTSRMVGKMVKKGLIEYAVDPDDKRCRPLRMTKKGYELAEKIDTYAHNKVEDALAQLDAEGKDLVVRGMQLYAKALRKARLKQEVSVEEMTPEEAPVVTRVLLDVLSEYGCNKPGFASQDEELHAFYEAYKKPKCKYFVAHLGKKVVGGAGIAPLAGGDGKTCELQKMYLLKDARGLGIGSLLLDKCLQAAKKFGFGLCYLETHPSMKEAQELYRRHGFKERKKRLGETGHWGCESFYEIEL